MPLVDKRNYGTYGKKKFFGRELDLINKFRNERPKGASLR